MKQFKGLGFFLSAAITLFSSQTGWGTLPFVGGPGDPATISAFASRLQAEAANQQARASTLLARANSELARANAAHQWALVRYLEEQRMILRLEWDEILRQQARIQRLIDAVLFDKVTVERIRLGKTDPMAFRALIRLMATSIEFGPIREVFIHPVEKLPASNFIPNDDETGQPLSKRDFPGGNVRQLLLFAIRNNFSFEPLEDAHFIVMDALGTVTNEAARRVLAYEQELQAIRASRITEVFLHPPQQ